MLTERRTISGITKSILYAYNLDGSLALLTYPSGRVVTYTYSAAARTLSGVDSANSVNYALNATYGPHGGLTSVLHGQSGGFGGITLSQTYNARLQPTTMVASSSNGTVLDFSYGFNYGSANNGNVASIANNRNANRSQTFTYDELNRIKTAQSQATAGPDCWGLSFGYDLWANLLAATVTQCSAPMLSLGVDTNNRITNTGFSYDAAGNLLADGSFTYTWDGESRLKTAAGVTYTYDGDGRRVKKSNGKLYWNDLGGEVLAESDLAGTITDEFIFFNGKRIARRSSSGSVYYYFADHLGSARVMTNATGVVQQESDYYPFGGERVIVNTVDNRYKFTGKERDSESGLDNFGARYFASPLGWFQSPDPLLNSGRPWQPQSWNRYAYSLNNPLNFIDPTGLYEWAANTCATDDKKCNKQYEKNQQKVRDSLANLEKARDKYKPGSKEYNRLDAALKAYGNEGEKNGVSVAFGKLEGDATGRTFTHADDAGNISFTVQFDTSKIGGANDFAISTGHEGTHVDDIRNPLFANPQTTLDPFQQEFRGYQTSAWVARGLGLGNLGYKGVEIWNSSWSNVDRLMDQGITRFLTTRRDPPVPEKNPHNPREN